MSTPEEKARKRMRLKVKARKDKRTIDKVRAKKKQNKQPEALDVTKLTHADLVKLINEKADDVVSND